LDEENRVVDIAPIVTLTIESGPGEFPTGRSITFDAEGDIKIVAGQAAMALRSYYGGTTRIRATSAGLADAVLEIETIGEPRWVEGLSPIVSERLYVPPQPSPAALAAIQNAVNVARDRPSRASSEIPDHPARAGNDGRKETSWLATDEDDLPWYQLDLEGFYQLSSGRVTFAEAGNIRYLIELSNDAQTWTLVSDKTETVNESAQRLEIFPTGAEGRYMRLRCTYVQDSVKVGLVDIELLGILSVR
jgi:hypothetical protein